MTYELFQQGPAVYIPAILLSLAITLLAYGAFPLVFVITRNKPITKKNYYTLCYCINAVVMVLFIIWSGDPTSGGPYLLWTWIFSSLGVKILKKQGLLEESQPVLLEETENVSNNTVANNNSAPATSTTNKNIALIGQKNVPTSKKVSKGIIVLLVVLGISLIVTIVVGLTKCKYFGCHNTATENSKFCVEHTCWLSRCHNAVIENGKFCVEHTCSYSGCYNHGVLKKDVNSPVLGAKPVVTYKYCSNHKCNLQILSFSCDNPSIEGGKYCSVHTCAIDGCSLETYGGSDYCSSHKCNYQNLSCNNPTIQGGKYCNVHPCAIDGCSLETTLLSRYCSFHAD